MKDIIDQFLAEHPVCFDGPRVRGECDIMSSALLKRLPQGRKIRLNGYKLTPVVPCWSIARQWWSHTAIVIDNTVIDVTARQFDYSYPVPRIMTLDDVLEEWDSYHIETWEDGIKHLKKVT